MFRRLTILFFTLLISASVYSQPTRVRGRVTDAATGEALQFVNIVFAGTFTGTATDEQGIYSLETREEVDSLQVIFLGYDEQTLPIKRHVLNIIDVKLAQSVFNIDNVIIRPGPNPAHPVLDSVNRYKYRNDPSRLDKYSVSTYTKMELDLSNVKKREFKSKRMQKNFGFIFQHIDTSAMTGQAYLPVMISETAAEFYHSNRPPVSREIIKASRVSGFEDNSTVAQFTGQLYADINFYENYIELFNVRFASPLSSHGRLLYNYFLIDSTAVEGRKTYKIRFHPKGTATPVLDGEVLIDSATYALRSASARMPRGVNVNWIRHLTLENRNRMVNDTLWFRESDRLSADFSVVMSDSSKTASFIGTREVNYTDLKLGIPPPPEVMRMTGNIIVEKDVTRNDEEFWSGIRPYELSEKEKSIYRMVDSVQDTPLYRSIYTVINTIIGGYLNTKYIGFGPYSRTISFNNLEGLRFQFGFRTTNQMSRKIRLSGYAAYSLRDEAFKGGGGIEFAFNKALTRKLTLKGSHDVAQLGQRETPLTDHNIFGSVLSRGNRRMSMIDRAAATYDHEWFSGFTTTISAEWEHISSNRFVEMRLNDGTTLSGINNPMLHLGFRLSFDETVLRQPFDKIYMGSDYPIIQFNFTSGLKGLLPDSYEYYRLSAAVQYRIPTPPAGYSDITVQGGHIFGRVPYLLLKLPEGNSTYFYDRHSFSCMNFYEFAADSWVSLFFEHHFNGFFLGKIPLLKRLKLREVITFKGIYGVLSSKNDGSYPGSTAAMLFPEGMRSLSTPYMEIGAGIENILRICRVDFVWRLTHREHTKYDSFQNFAINFSLNLKF